MCLSFCRTAYNLPAVYASASDDWAHAKYKHETTSWADIPKGGLVHFAGDNPDGHIALYDGDGNICTTNSGLGYPVVQSISLWESWGYRMLGWAEDCNGYHVCYPDGSSDIPDSEVIVPYTSITTHKEQSLNTGGDWTTLHIDDDAHTSIITTPGGFAAEVQVTIHDMPEGTAGKLRFFTVDYGGSETVVDSHYPIQEFIATAGDTYTGMVQFGKLGKASKSGHSLRLRVQAAINSDVKCKTGYVGVRVFH